MEGESATPVGDSVLLLLGFPKNFGNLKVRIKVYAYSWGRDPQPGEAVSPRNPARSRSHKIIPD